MKILIVGCSGFVGSNLARKLCEQHEIIGIYNTNRPNLPQNIKKYKIDATSESAVELCIKDFKPQVVINAAGNKNLQCCERFPYSAYNSNVTVTAALVNVCREVGTKYVHISTDLVFSGNTHHYFELNTPDPNTVYGRTKYAAEIIAQIMPGALIIRTGGLYGIGSPLFAKAYRLLSDGKPIDGFGNIVNRPLYVVDFASLVNDLIMAGTSGIRHIFGFNIVDRHQLLSEYADVFGFDTNLIKMVNAPASFMMPERIVLASNFPSPLPVLRDGLLDFKDELLTCE